MPGFPKKSDGTNFHHLRNECEDYKIEENVKNIRNTSSRLSALSSKVSMGLKSENTDDISDIISLADSLDDTASSSVRNHDNKPVRGDLPPLRKKERKKYFKSSDAFFIPIKSDLQDDVKSSVSDYFPEKFKEKFSKRQLELREKLRQSKLNISSKLTQSNLKENRKKSKQNVKNECDEEKKKSTFLPKIEPRKFAIKPKRTKRKFRENSPSLKIENNESTHREHFRLYKTENEYIYDSEPKESYRKADFRNTRKRIEILEIMECIDFTRTEKIDEKFYRTKSKIPVPLPQKPRFLNPLSKRPTYLDFDKVVITDPKLDQLIANILIQTLHEKEHEKNINSEITNQENLVLKREKVKKVIETDKLEKTNKSSNFDHNSNQENSKENSTQVNETEIDNDPTSTPILTSQNEDLYQNTTNEGRKLQKLKNINEITNKMGDEHSGYSNSRSFRSGISHKNDGSNSTRNQYNIRSKTGEWSVVVSGNNNAEFSSDLEMKIRFPTLYRRNFVVSSQHSSDNVRVSEEKNSLIYSRRRSYFSQIPGKYSNEIARTGQNVKNSLKKLPDIRKKDNPDKFVEQTLSKFMEIPDDMRPRQTKTSLKRYNMTRPKIPSLFESNLYEHVRRHYPGILETLPQFLGVTGYPIKPERKYEDSIVTIRGSTEHNGPNRFM